MIVAVMALALVFMAGAGLMAADSSADDATTSIVFDSSSVATEATVDATITFNYTGTYEQIEVTYTAKLTNSSGTTQSDAVSPSTGSLSPGVKETLTVTAPEDAGTYKLTVVFEYTVDDGDEVEVTNSASLKVVTAITLSVDLTNNSTVDITNLLLDFYVDGKKVNDDPVKVSIAAGETETASYDKYAPENLLGGSHTLSVQVNEDSLLANSITGLDDDHTFYVGHSSYSLLNVLMAIFLILIIILAIYIYRKPVKNYGKPKARR